MGDGLPPDLVQLRSTLPIRALVLGTLRQRSSLVVRTSVYHATDPSNPADVALTALETDT